MKLKVVLFFIVIVSAVFLSAFGAPATSPNIPAQETVVPPDITVVAPTVVVQGTPAVPVTGGNAPPSMWTLVLFGLLGLLGIAFLVALFTPRTITHEHIDHVPPHDHDV